MLNLYYYRVFLLINSAILFAVYVAFGLNNDVTPYSYIYLLLINVYMLLRSRQNFLLFIVFFIIFYSNYSIVYSNFIVKNDDTMFTDVLSQRTQFVSLNILVLFNLLIFLLVKWRDVSPHSDENIYLSKEKNDKTPIIILGIILVIVFFVGFQLPEEEGARGNPSSIYEYSVIFFILYFYYTGESRLFKGIGLIFVLMYSLQNFIFGGRIYGIQFLLTAYIMNFMYKTSMYKVVVGITLMFFLFSIIGVVRGELMSMNFSLGNIFSLILNRGFALDTAYSAYYTSESFVYMDERLDDKMIPIRLFGEFLKSIIIGSGDNPDSVLPTVTHEYVTHYNGGILPFYLYFYLGAFGILLVAILTSFYINMIISLVAHSSSIKKCITVWIASTTFRWYLYGPLPLLRGVLLLVLCYYLFAYILFEWNRICKGLKAPSREIV